MLKGVGCVILNYCDPKGVLNLLEKNGDIFEKIVVVDNFSNDDSIIIINNYLSEHKIKNVELITLSQNEGFARGNNAGIKKLVEHYLFDYIICINTDIIINNEVIIKCLEELKKQEKTGLLSTRMYEFNGEEGVSAWKFPSYGHLLKLCFWLYRKNHSFNKSYSINNEKMLKVDVVRGSFLVFKSSCLKEINYFDTNTFLYYEENILCKKLQKSKFEVVLLTDSFYIHNHPPRNKITINMSNFKANLKSTEYYLKEYEKIGKVKLFIFKLCEKYSFFEQKIVNVLKLKIKREK